MEEETVSNNIEDTFYPVRIGEVSRVSIGWSASLDTTYHLPHGCAETCGNAVDIHVDWAGYLFFCRDDQFHVMKV